MNKRIINEYNNYKKHINKTSSHESTKYISPISIKYNDILKIYNINNIDDLEKWIKKNLDNLNFFTINRILNSWIRVNFKILKKHPKYLIHIYNTIFKNYCFEIDYYKYNKYIESFIIQWLKEKNNNDYYINLYYDLKEYMIKNNII